MYRILILATILAAPAMAERASKPDLNKPTKKDER
jgi:hypothetical protein